MGTYYRNAEQYLDRVDPGAWIEIGVDRGEGSTRWFATHARQRGAKFYGVDIDPQQIAQASARMLETGEMVMLADGRWAPVVGSMPDHVSFTVSKGEDFVSEFAEKYKEPISVVYLDNFDWDYWLGRQEESFVPVVKQKYREEFKVEMNNMNSQLTHLKQTIALIPQLTANSVVICDDTWYLPEEGIFSGKCSAAIPLLLTAGFAVLHTDGYRQNSGVIMGRFNDC
jgi:hypothetical protein